jgi:hypothetical protein
MVSMGKSILKLYTNDYINQATGLSAGVGGREKMRPGNGREAGLGHAAVKPAGRYRRLPKNEPVSQPAFTLAKSVFPVTDPA